MTEENAEHSPWNKFLSENRETIRRVTKLVRRKDRPSNLSNWSPEVSAFLDNNPDEADYAIYLWRDEAEARANDLDALLEPVYFFGLSRTLTAYGQYIGVSVPSLLEFEQRTTSPAHGQHPAMRKAYDSSLDPLYLTTENELFILKSTLLQRTFSRKQPASGSKAEKSPLELRPEESPKPTKLERELIALIKRLDAERAAGGDPNSTGDQLARLLNRKFSASFRTTVAAMKRHFILRNVKGGGYALGPFAEWFCPDNLDQMSGQTTK